MQGNCEMAPADSNLPSTMETSVPRDPWVKGQCMIVTSKPLFVVMSGNAWLDKLILAAAPETSAPMQSNITLLEVRQTWQGPTGSNIFLTDMVFKGDNVTATRAIAMSPEVAGGTAATTVQKFHSLLARGACSKELYGFLLLS
jgi:hypothetical protein